jgi:hypothetical protein
MNGKTVGYVLYNMRDRKAFITCIGSDVQRKASKVLNVLYMTWQGLVYKNISCVCHITFYVLQTNVMEAAYYSKAPLTQTTSDLNQILKQIVSYI